MASILVFATISLAVLAASRSTVVAASAEIDQARLNAAADAGFALAVASLLHPGPAGLPPLDGRARHLRYREAMLTIAIEDEQGKMPLNALEDEQARRLFTLLGVTGERLDIVTDSFLDWIDEDDDPRPFGAETDFYTPQHIRIRNGSLRSVAEAGQIRGFDARLVTALEGVSTVHFGRGTFRPEHASLIAIEALEGEDEGAVDLINRQRVLAGQSTALAFEEEKSLAGRPLTIAVSVQLDNGARRRVRTLIIPTGRPAQPYVVRERN